MLYDHLCSRTQSLHAMIEARADFEAMHVPETNILCFRWTGDGTRSDDALDTINLELRSRYNRDGHGWITTTVLGDRRVLRVTIMNPRTTPGHLASLLDELSREAATIVAS